MPRLTPRHGTVTWYVNHKCRCAVCLDHWAAHMRAYRAKRKAQGLCMECPKRTPRYRCDACRADYNRYCRTLRGRSIDDAA